MKEHTMKKMVGVSFFISAAMVAVAGTELCYSAEYLGNQLSVLYHGGRLF